VLSNVQCAAGKLDAARQTLQLAAERITDVPQRRDLVAALVALADSRDPLPRQAVLREQAARDPADVRTRVMLLDQPAVRQDSLQAQKLIDEIRRIEGEGGLTWRMQQARLWLDGNAWRERQKLIESCLSRCIEADPRDEQAVLVLGQMYERCGEWAAA